MNSTPQTLTELIWTVTGIIQLVIPILIALALFYFMWSLMTLLMSGLGNKDEIKKSRNRMLWGVIVLFILLSVGGILAIVENTFFRGSTYQGAPYRSYRTGGDYIYETGGEVFLKPRPNEPSFCIGNRWGFNCPQRVN